MKIPDELLKRWTDLRSFGDGKKIVESNPEVVNEIDISRAFTKGECADDVFKVIADFYKKKEEEQVKPYLQ